LESDAMNNSEIIQSNYQPDIVKKSSPSAILISIDGRASGLIEAVNQNRKLGRLINN